MINVSEHFVKNHQADQVGLKPIRFAEIPVSFSCHATAEHRQDPRLREDHVMQGHSFSLVILECAKYFKPEG